MRRIDEREKRNSLDKNNNTDLQSLKSRLEAALEPGDRDLPSSGSVV